MTGRCSYGKLYYVPRPDGKFFLQMRRFRPHPGRVAREFTEKACNLRGLWYNDTDN